MDTRVDSIERPNMFSTPLKSSTPDLTIVLKDGKERYHAGVLASHSQFIDTCLSFRAASESVVDLSDIDGNTWQEMLYYLEPNRAGDIRMEAVIRLVPLYDKYGFIGACKLCDNTAEDFLRAVNEESDRFDCDRFDTIIAAAISVLSNPAFEESKNHYGNWLRSILTTYVEDSFGPQSFQPDHIESLRPFILEMVCWDNSIGEELHPDSGESFSKTDVESPLFPALYVSLWADSLRTNNHVAGLTLLGSGVPDWDGSFSRESDGCFEREFDRDGSRVFVTPCRKGACWVISTIFGPGGSAEEAVEVFRSEITSDLRFPPRQGWMLTSEGFATHEPNVVVEILPPGSSN